MSYIKLDEKDPRKPPIIIYNDCVYIKVNIIKNLFQNLETLMTKHNSRLDISGFQYLREKFMEYVRNHTPSD